MVLADTASRPLSRHFYAREVCMIRLAHSRTEGLLTSCQGNGGSMFEHCVKEIGEMVGGRDEMRCIHNKWVVRTTSRYAGLCLAVSS